jgi:hypothetical protein
MAKVTVAFSLDDEVDADILHELAELPKRKRSAAFRAAWRANQAAANLTLGDVMNELGEIRRALRNGAVIQHNGERAADTQQETDPLAQTALAAIDGLGEL